MLPTTSTNHEKRVPDVLPISIIGVGIGSAWQCVPRFLGCGTSFRAAVNRTGGVGDPLGHDYWGCSGEPSAICRDGQGRLLTQQLVLDAPAAVDNRSRRYPNRRMQAFTIP